MKSEIRTLGHPVRYSGFGIWWILRLFRVLFRFGFHRSTQDSQSDQAFFDRRDFYRTGTSLIRVFGWSGLVHLNHPVRDFRRNISCVHNGIREILFGYHTSHIEIQMVLILMTGFRLSHSRSRIDMSRPRAQLDGHERKGSHFRDSGPFDVCHPILLHADRTIRRRRLG